MFMEKKVITYNDIKKIFVGQNEYDYEILLNIMLVLNKVRMSFFIYEVDRNYNINRYDNLKKKIKIICKTYTILSFLELHNAISLRILIVFLKWNKKYIMNNMNTEIGIGRILNYPCPGDHLIYSNKRTNFDVVVYDKKMSIILFSFVCIDDNIPKIWITRVYNKIVNLMNILEYNVCIFATKSSKKYNILDKKGINFTKVFMNNYNKYYNKYIKTVYNKKMFD